MEPGQIRDLVEGGTGVALEGEGMGAAARDLARAKVAGGGVGVLRRAAELGRDPVVTGGDLFQSVGAHPVSID